MTLWTRIKRWNIKRKIQSCYEDYESLHRFQQFECSDFFVGDRMARRNRQWARREENKIDKRLEALQAQLKELK